MPELAPYACHPARTAGRLAPEAPARLRSDYQRDRDRVVHATAFRRLEHKTQVLVSFEGDHFRTRLTHSLEVAQIARTLARVLMVDEDLAEAIALAHDLGHSAFGHAGEAALDAGLRGFGGFDHNLQTFRVVTRLERRYLAFDGLNLTAETLEGLVKHNGPQADVPAPIRSHGLFERFQIDRQAPLEAQIAAVADDVAYTNHDLDDGLRAGFFGPADLLDLPLVGPIVGAIVEAHPGAREEQLAHEIARRLIDRMVADLVATAAAGLDRLDPASPDAIRAADAPLVAFSAKTAEGLAAVRGFLHARMYRHYKVNRTALKARRLIVDLVEAFLAAPETLPDRWRALADGPGSPATADAVRDYVAGMTDRYALDEHDRLFRLFRDRS